MGAILEDFQNWIYHAMKILIRPIQVKNSKITGIQPKYNRNFFIINFG